MRRSQRPLGYLSLTSLVIANMIGAGVFTTSGYALADLGSRGAVLAAWLVGALIATCGAISYGSLAKRMNQSGGEYLYLSRVVHPTIGFLSGWISLLAGFTGAIAFAATTLEVYLRPIAPAFSTLPEGTLATGGIAAGVAMHIFSTRGGASLQTAMVMLKILALVTFLAIGLLTLDNPGIHETAEPHTHPTPVLAFATSIMRISLSYSGFNAAIYVAGESDRAATVVPRAMLTATILVSFLYLGLNTVFLYSAPVGSIAGQADIAAVASRAIGGVRLEGAMRLVVIACMFTSISSMTMAGPRVYAQMARDGVFPKVFESVTTPPTFAMILQGVLAIAVVWITGIGELLSYLGMTLGLSTMTAVGCLFVLRLKSNDATSSPWSLIAPGVFVTATAGSILLSGYHQPVELAAATISILSGCLAYLLFRHGSSAVFRANGSKDSSPDFKRDS